jgi:hypothetical protein
MSKTRAPDDGARPPAAGKTTAPAAKQARSGPKAAPAKAPLAASVRRAAAK